MKLSLLKIGLLGAAMLFLFSMTSCVVDPYGNTYGTAYGSYTYTNYPYGYTTTALPYGYSSIYIGGARYWHCNNHYYRHYPGRGYVVVKRPHGHPSYQRPAYHRPVHYKPAKYSHYKGNRDVYQNRPNHSHRGTGPQAVPSTRYGNSTSSGRYNTVRTQPVNVRPMGTPAASKPRVKTRPTTQSSRWKSNSSDGGSTIHRNPTGRSTSSHSGMSRGGGSRGGGSRGGGSSGGGSRGRF